MNLSDYLEQDREKLLNNLTAAGTPEKAVAVMEEELDHVLLLYNEQCEIAVCREAAAGMLQAAKLALPLADCVSEVRVWEKSGAETQKTRSALWGVLLSVLALAAALGGLGILFVSNVSGIEPRYMLVIALLAVASPVIAFLGGRVSYPVPKANTKKGAGEKQYRTECRIDAEKCRRTLRAILFAADRELESLPERLNAGKNSAESREMSKEELELMSSLCEAAWSHDGDFALEKLEDVKYYLHTVGIETEEYDGTNPQHFDFLPAVSMATYRPALLKDGVVVHRGLAAR